MEYSRLGESNPWWKDKNAIDQDINLVRLEKQKINWEYRLINSFEEGIYSIRGPRQVGKTTWIKQKIKELLKNNNPQNIFFYSCDDIKNFESLMELIDLFLELTDKQKRKYLFLDEIPFVEDWQRAIKHLYDSGKLVNCVVVLSGSNSIDIKRSVEQLPGRGDEGKKHFIMMPLTFSQYLSAIGKHIKFTNDFRKNLALTKLNQKILMNEYNNYLLTGVFLRIINEFFSTSNISDSSYDVYLKWIIGDLAKYELKENFSKQLLRKILQSYTSELSWSSLKSDTDIDSHHTVSKYVNSIEEMFVINILYKMDLSKKIPSYPKSKKIYFSDPFILGACHKWINSLENNFESLKEYVYTNTDKISEGVLLNHLINIIYSRIKSNIYDYKDLIYYWTNKEKTKEVDFVHENTGFEVKFAEKIKSEHYKGLKEFSKGFLITKKTYDQRTLPLPAFLLLLEHHPDKFL